MTKMMGGGADGLRAFQLFNLAFGVAVGIGWIMVMGAWLEAAGPLGSLTAFAATGAVMLTVAYSYAAVAIESPVAGGEFVYATRAFGARVGMWVGWFLALAYVVVIAFEMVSLPWVIRELVPGLPPAPSGSWAFDPVGLMIGSTALLGVILFNLKGAATATRLQDTLVLVKVVLSLLLLVAGLIFGEVRNLTPLWGEQAAGSAAPGILAVLAMAPFFYSGFGVISQAVGEVRKPETIRRLPWVMAMIIVGTALFYILIILASAMAAPRALTLGASLPASAAFAFWRTVIYTGKRIGNDCCRNECGRYQVKRWIVIANCQAFGLAKSISSLAPSLHCDAADLWQYQRQMREDPGFYRAHYDFAILSEEVRLWHPYEPSDLPPHIDIPNFTFSAFHPDCCYVTAEGKIVEGVVGPYQSMIALAAYKEHLPPVPAAAFFNESVFEYAGFFDLWEEQRNRLITQFAAAGVSIGPALRRMSHGNSFMFTVNHPKIEMLFEVARAILVSRGEEVWVGSWPPPETLASTQWPIYPEIGRRLGLPGGYCFKPADEMRPIGLAEFLERSHGVFSKWDKSQLSIDPAIRPRLWRIRELMREAA